MLNSTGIKIKELRNKYNLTQQQLADMVGVSNKAVSKWESGEGLPDIENLKRLSSVLNISIDELLSNEVQKRKSSPLDFSLMFTIALTILIYFLPFMRLNPFDFPEVTFITLTGVRLIMDSLTSFQIGNLVVGISLILILSNASLQIYYYYLKKTFPKKRILSFASFLASIVILGTIYLITLNQTVYVEMTFVPFILVLTQMIQFVLQEMIDKETSQEIKRIKQV